MSSPEPDARVAAFLAVSRFRTPESEGPAFAVRAAEALEALSQRPGFVDGSLGRSADDPELWALISGWVGIGAYRRALSAYDVKVTAVPLLATAIDEPGGFEMVSAVGPHGVGPAGRASSDRAEDAAVAAPGSAAAPYVPNSLDVPDSLETRS